MIDVLSWQCEVPVTAGEVPPRRFGCSMTVHADKLWVVGGGYGRDLARSGHDLKDVYTLDLLSRPMEWSKVTMMNTLPQPQGDNAMGRCHASSRVGNKLVMFGGSLGELSVCEGVHGVVCLWECIPRFAVMLPMFLEAWVS